MKNPNTKDEMKKAFTLGAEAFDAGKRAAPCLDPKALAMLTGKPIGAGIPLFKAWIKGFQAREQETFLVRHPEFKEIFSK